MNKRIFRLCAGLSALALPASFAHAQGLPPPPPPIGPNSNAGPTTAPPQVQFPQENPATNPTLPPVSAAGPVLITVDAAAKRHDISPLIYCVSTANPAQLAALNTTINPRQVGPGLLNFPVLQTSVPARVFSSDTSPDTQALRNRSTRLLWDPNYGNPSGKVSGNVALIPRLKNRLSAYPAGTKAGITNYSWGAENTIGGATAQADVLGIFGREGLDLATRTAPAPATPTFKAMQLYRNYDSHNAAFGSISVSDTVPDSDTLASFASVRRSDGVLTIMVINKASGAPTPISLAVSHFTGPTAQVWQLTSANAITHLPNTALSGGSLSATLPAQSITLFVVAAGTKQ